MPVVKANPSLVKEHTSGFNQGCVIKLASLIHFTEVIGNAKLSGTNCLSCLDAQQQYGLLCQNKALSLEYSGFHLLMPHLMS